jgi:integrase
MDNLRELLNGTKTEQTVDRYIEYWNRYVEFCGSEDEAKKSENFAAWRQHMVNVDKYAANTINVRMNSVRSVMATLSEHKIVPREIKWDFAETKGVSPRALLDRRRPNNRVAITAKQMRNMIGSPQPDLYEPLYCMHRALLLVLGTTGMRIGEVVRMEIDDVAQVGDNYVVRNIMGKTDIEPRMAPLSEEGYDAIRDWIHIRPVQSNYVFISCNRTKSSDSDNILWNEGHMTASTALRVIKKYGKKIGMPHIKAHDFRRFVGTQLATKKSIRVAQKVLGHKSPETTAKYYILDEAPMGVTNELF